MKKLEKRAVICLALAAVLILGLMVFTYRFVRYGGDWATFYANQSVYRDGRLAIGSVYDVNGVLLAENGGGTVKYNSDEGIRRGTLHAVGDMDGNISTSALSAFKDDIVGYSLLTGTYSMTGRGNNIRLTIDADVSKAAYEALGGKSGCIGVYNYETGDILCMVSSPGFDPANPPEISPDDSSGLYINRFLSATYAPGSIFKLVTSAAAIENLSDLDSWTYNCTGETEINGEKIRCANGTAHGVQDFEAALANSCNCAFADLTQRIGANTMTEYAVKCGLTDSYDIDGIFNVKGSFEFPETPFNLAWAGIGQYNDQLNPCSMMVYMGAIAEGGRGAVPNILYSALSVTERTDRMIEESTAMQLRSMMKNNVVKTYGEGNFPGLDIYAKSGTAEVAGKSPTAWFAGFIENEDAPYAFIVCVENSGFGSQVAAPVAGRVLQAAVEANR